MCYHIKTARAVKAKTQGMKGPFWPRKPGSRSSERTLPPNSHWKPRSRGARAGHLFPLYHRWLTCLRCDHSLRGWAGLSRAVFVDGSNPKGVVHIGR